MVGPFTTPLGKYKVKFMLHRMFIKYNLCCTVSFNHEWKWTRKPVRLSYRKSEGSVSIPKPWPKTDSFTSTCLYPMGKVRSRALKSSRNAHEDVRERERKWKKQRTGLYLLGNFLRFRDLLSVGSLFWVIGPEDLLDMIWHYIFFFINYVELH